MRKLWPVFGFFLISSGCTSVSQPDGSIPIDLALIRPYVFAMEKERPYSPPYVATFSKRGKSLVYIAAAHVSVEKSPDLLLHPTFLTIARVFSDRAIDAVIVEGTAPWAGRIPADLLAHGELCAATGYRSNCGESWFAIQQAKKHGAAIYTGEPSESEVLRLVVSKGFTASDVLGFYIVRQIPQWKREGEFKEEHLISLIEKQLRSSQKALGTNLDFGYPDFVNWYQAHMKKPASFQDIEVDDTAPVSDVSATYVQSISSIIGVARDQAIAAKVAEVLTRHLNVLIVYGASHYLTQRLALQQSLGQAQHDKPF